MFVNDTIARNAVINGKLIGRTEPSQETKYSWWQVYVLPNDEIIACVFTDDTGVCCGELITQEQLGQYVDDEVEARKLLDNSLISDRV